MIDENEAIKTLREVVAERPDFVYAPPGGEPGNGRCLYVHDAEPGCLVGVVLHRLGVSLEELSTHENVPAKLLYTEDNGELVTYRAAQVLGSAQFMQDAGHGWSEALAAAERRYAA